MAGRLQSPDSQREEAACAVGGREDGGRGHLPPKWLSGEGRAALTTASPALSSSSPSTPSATMAFQVLGKTNVLLSLFITTEIGNTFRSTLITIVI